MSITATLPERYNATTVVDRQVAAGRGDKTAFVAADRTMTYEDLRRDVDRAGRLLRTLGVGREDRVLLVLDDTTAFPVAFLGAMRIGAVPVPVSPMDKAENFRHYVEDSYASVVVADAERLADLRRVLTDKDVVYLAPGASGPGVVDFDAGLAAQDDTPEPADTHRDDMAFWLYSSGSTGKPKGVVHLHHDIEVTCETYAREILALREDDVTFSTTKLYHAYGLGNGLSFPLWFGATSVLMRGRAKPDAILETLRGRRPTVFFSVPAVYGGLVRNPAADGALDSVRLCVSAAEALAPQIFDQWRERFGLEIIDGIGSTEMLHIYCSNRPGQVARATTGHPVPGYELRIVDESGAVLDGPAVGALEVRGDSCAAFYWHQHEKSKSSMKGEWFATGDRYERTADGAYAYVGRMDDMLKVGGLWVSPIDMEHVLMQHPRVLGVGVVGISVQDASRVAAYVECDGEGDEALADELREWCKTRMRRYEYPHVVEFVSELPRTLTGKVQRFRLREMSAATTDAR
jgi:benzoate-CoA ligase family protein